MRKQKIKTGFTLTELLTVIAVIVMLVAIGMPAAREALESFESSVGVRHFISSALGSARAIAASQQKYAGLRFQHDLDGNQYMIFIVHDKPATNLAYGFRAVGGYKAMKLPRDVGVMDYARYDEDIDDPCELTDATTFSIVFSPAGKLVIHDVRVRNITGQGDIFNTRSNVDDGIGMFYRDDYADLGLGQEPSRNHFVVYDKREFKLVDTESRWTDYLQYLEVVYVSPYTGQIINK